MSSKPSKEGVKELRKKLIDFRFLSARLETLRAAASKLPETETEVRTLHAEIVKMLDEMDVASRGNFGWEARMVWFLNELDDQAAASAKPDVGEES